MTIKSGRAKREYEYMSNQLPVMDKEIERLTELVSSKDAALKVAVEALEALKGLAGKNVPLVHQIIDHALKQIKNV